MLMLKATQFPFVIDLACLAARRDYLKLDMWVSERIKSHQVLYLTVITIHCEDICTVLISPHCGIYCTLEAPFDW